MKEEPRLEFSLINSGQWIRETGWREPRNANTGRGAGCMMSLITVKVGIMNLPRIKRVSVSKTPRYLSPASARCWTFVFTLDNVSPKHKQSHDQLTGAR